MAGVADHHGATDPISTACVTARSLRSTNSMKVEVRDGMNDDPQQEQDTDSPWTRSSAAVPRSEVWSTRFP